MSVITNRKKDQQGDQWAGSPNRVRGEVWGKRSGQGFGEETVAGDCVSAISEVERFGDDRDWGAVLG